MGVRARAARRAARRSAIAPPEGAALKDAFFLPFDEGKIEPAKPQALSREGGAYRLALPRRGAAGRGRSSAFPGSWFSSDKAFTVDAPIAARFADLGLAFALLLAFGGGLLLNLMPCVLPVLSIKALGFAQGEGGAAPRAALFRRRAGLVLGRSPRC